MPVSVEVEFVDGAHYAMDILMDGEITPSPEVKGLASIFGEHLGGYRSDGSQNTKVPLTIINAAHVKCIHVLNEEK